MIINQFERKAAALQELNNINPEITGYGKGNKKINGKPAGDEFSILNKIGNTPLIEIQNVTGYLPTEIKIYAKAEWFNPGGSVKDRAALNMILDGERRGLLTHGKIIIDATSGNTGIAYALISAIRGYKIKLVLPSNASSERKKILEAYGAEIILSNPLEGTDGAQRVAKEIFEKNKEKYFYPDQYNILLTGRLTT
jgi:cysteine synthase B